MHTSAPSALEHFHMRNQQLKRLNQEIAMHQTQRASGEQVMMVGDFNISPWSSYYKTFAHTLSPFMQNAFLKRASAFTRCLKEEPWICSHIDHLFLSEKLQLESLKVKKVPGSDHRAMIFTIVLES